ncbi:calpastatin [Camelus ferus]|nr:calpastatin [Camelus ferus]
MCTSPCLGINFLCFNQQVFQYESHRNQVSDGGKSAVAGVAAASGKPADKSGMDTALDDLIDTLGEPERTEEDNTTYTGPEVLKPLGPDDAIDALSSDFTCSSPAEDGKKTEKEKPTGEVLKAQSAGIIQSAAPPHEKKRKVEEDAMSDQALEALSASLGTRKPEPELDLSSIKEVDEAKAKEEKLKKCGEDDETVPSEYRLKPATEPQAAGPAPVGEAVPRTSLCSVQSAPPKPAASKGMVPEDAVEALAGSLGKKAAEPEDGKPVEDKVKEKAKEEDREKLGEKEETIPPDYRLEEAKDKDGKPLLPKEPKEPLPPLSEDFLLDALSKDFTGPPNTSSLSDNKEFDDALDQLSDSLGQRQLDPDENKPIEDKVKKPAEAQDPIDALSGDFDSCSSTTETSQDTAKDKNKKTASRSKAPKNGGKAKDSAKRCMRLASELLL